MRKNLASGRYLLLSALGGWLVACGLDTDLPNRTGSPAPANTGVTLSGAGARDDAAVAGYGASSRITDIHAGSAENGNGHASDDLAGGTDSGGAFDEGQAYIGGAASVRSGAAGAGGQGGYSANQEASAGSDDGTNTDPPRQPPPLWFSEYVEGSSSNKALEISSRTRSVLDGCKVCAYFNGKAEATVIASLTGVLEADRVLTLCTSTLKEKLPNACNQVGNLTFNGDDALTLSCDGTLLDVIGQLGTDPGAGWGSEPNSTVDHTLRRRCNVDNGDVTGADLFEPSVEWQSFPIDTFDGLGSRGC